MRSKKALINIISSVILQMVTIICGFIVPRLYISHFGSNVNGLISSITQYLAYITLLESGFGPVVKSILFKPIADKDTNTIERILKTSEVFFRKIACIFCVYILILCAVFPVITAKEFDALFTISLVIIVSISTFAEYYFGMTYNIYLQANQKKYIISIIHVVTLILNTIAIIILIHLGASIQVVRLISCIIFVFRPILQNLYVRKKMNIDLSQVEGNYKIEQKWEGLIQHIAFVVHKNTDIVLLSFCVSMAEISVYSVYAMVVNSIKNLVQSFTGGIDATFGDMIAKGEDDILNKSFKFYEGIYITLATICFGSTLFLIVPFVSVYTHGIKDINYIRPTFAYIFVCAEFLWAIRQPYNDLAKVAGHFRETRTGALIEVIANLFVSIVLVGKLGIVGVAIGTVVAMSIRTVEFMYHTSKYILKRDVWYTLKRLIVIWFEIVTIAYILKFIPSIKVDSYITWIMQAVIVGTVSAFVVLSVNCFVYKENLQDIITRVKKMAIK